MREPVLFVLINILFISFVLSGLSLNGLLYALDPEVVVGGLVYMVLMTACFWKIECHK